MCLLQLPQEIDDEERVARVLFAPSYLSEGRVAPTAFRWYHLNGGPEKYISVLRNNNGSIEEQAVIMRPRDDGDTRYGYSWLKVKEVRGINGIIENMNMKVEVKAHPNKRLPNHAGIEVYINDSIVTADTPSCSEISLVQKLLANSCSTPIPFSGNKENSL